MSRKPESRALWDFRGLDEDDILHARLGRDGRLTLLHIANLGSLRVRRALGHPRARAHLLGLHTLRAGHGAHFRYDRDRYRQCRRNLQGFFPGTRFPESFFQVDAFCAYLREPEVIGPEDSFGPDYGEAMFEFIEFGIQGLYHLMHRSPGDVPRDKALTNWRYYDDPPEFFHLGTTLVDQGRYGLLIEGGVHWRGCAYYCSRDGDPPRVHASAWAALVHAWEWQAGFIGEQSVLGGSYFEDFDDEEADTGWPLEGDLVVFGKLLESYRRDNRIALDDGARAGVLAYGCRRENGLRLPFRKRDWAWPADLKPLEDDLFGFTERCLASPALLRRYLERLDAATRDGKPAAALVVAHGLLYWWPQGRRKADRSRIVATLAAAYRALGRPLLAEVVEAHDRVCHKPEVVTV